MDPFSSAIVAAVLFAVTPFLSVLVLAFLFKIFVKEDFPTLVGVAIGLAFVGFDAGLTSIAESPSIDIALKILFATILAGWGSRFGNKFAGNFSKDHTLKETGYHLLKRSLYIVSGKRFIEITMPAASDIQNIYGKKPVSNELKKEIGGKKFVLPADLPIEILEARIKRRLINDWRVGDAEVKLNEEGNVARLSLSAKKTRISGIIPKGKVLFSFKPESIPFELGYGDMINIVVQDMVVRKVEVISVIEDTVSVMLHPGDAERLARKITAGLKPSVIVFPDMKKHKHRIKQKEAKLNPNPSP
ncbi:MAG: hypothetical protein JXB14_00405 [Candidatus Altiarchaeota archaeon]|nr:hypothetical protein [Candidatus Altiarchaeota archaeon]